jgi:peroxiredoxin Q/BCP
MAGGRAVGERAPDFALLAADGSRVRLSDFRGRRVVLYFYPKDDTPGCTREACGFQGHLEQFRRRNAVILGVSADDGASHRRFAEKFGLAFPLLSDPDHAVGRAYGVYKRKSLYGRTYWGIERTTVLIDEQGRIKHWFPKVKVDGHTQAVLDALGPAASHGPGEAPRARPHPASTR